MMIVYQHDRMRGGNVIRALRRICEVVSSDVMIGEFDLAVRVEASEADRIRRSGKRFLHYPAYGHR